MRIAGFTGTHFGMSGAQKSSVELWLYNYLGFGVNIFLHGDCIGSDEEGADIARPIGYKIIGYPPIDEKRRAFFPNDHTWPAAPFIERDHKIVDQSQVMLATPRESYEMPRSGTWATIRYALKIGREIHIIQPNGNRIVHNEVKK